MGMHLMERTMSKQSAGLERELDANRLDSVSGGNAMVGLAGFVTAAFRVLQQSRHPESGSTGQTSGSSTGVKSASFDPVTVTFAK